VDVEDGRWMSDSDDFSYSGTFSLTDKTANGYPIWSHEHPEGHMLYIYLHDNGYIHVYHESSGPDAAIWRQRVDATACPYDFGYWNGEFADEILERGPNSDLLLNLSTFMEIQIHQHTVHVDIISALKHNVYVIIFNKLQCIFYTGRYRIFKIIQNYRILIISWHEYQPSKSLFQYLF